METFDFLLLLYKSFIFKVYRFNLNFNQTKYNGDNSTMCRHKKRYDKILFYSILFNWLYKLNQRAN